MAEMMPKLKSARVVPAGTRKSANTKRMAVCFNFFRINIFLEGVEIKPSIDDPLLVTQTHIPGSQSDNGHGKIKQKGKLPV